VNQHGGRKEGGIDPLFFDLFFSRSLFALSFLLKRRGGEFFTSPTPLFCLARKREEKKREERKDEPFSLFLLSSFFSLAKAKKGRLER
jgi:hypothetical protein